MGFFNEVVFSSKEKPKVETTTDNEALKNKFMFDVIYCMHKQDWISMTDCIACDNPSKRTLQEVLETGVGC